MWLDGDCQNVARGRNC